MIDRFLFFARRIKLPPLLASSAPVGLPAAKDLVRPPRSSVPPTPPPGSLGIDSGSFSVRPLVLPVTAPRGSLLVAPPIPPAEPSSEDASRGEAAALIEAVWKDARIKRVVKRVTKRGEIIVTNGGGPIGS